MDKDRKKKNIMPMLLALTAYTLPPIKKEKTKKQKNKGRRKHGF